MTTRRMNPDRLLEATYSRFGSWAFLSGGYGILAPGADTFWASKLTGDGLDFDSIRSYKPYLYLYEKPAIKSESLS